MSKYKQCEGSGQVADNLDYWVQPSHPWTAHPVVGECSVCGREVKVYKASGKARAHKDTRAEKVYRARSIRNGR